MSTTAQIIANRRNAQKSTGPRSSEGKAIASQNSLKHGLSARKEVIDSESQVEFDQYRERILGELDPVSPMESMLAERVVSLSWRLEHEAEREARSPPIDNPTADRDEPDVPAVRRGRNTSKQKGLRRHPDHRSLARVRGGRSKQCHHRGRFHADRPDRWPDPARRRSRPRGERQRGFPGRVGPSRPGWR